MSLAFVRGIHRGPVNSPHKGPVTRKIFPFDDVIMSYLSRCLPGCGWRWHYDRVCGAPVCVPPSWYPAERCDPGSSWPRHNGTKARNTTWGEINTQRPINDVYIFRAIVYPEKFVLLLRTCHKQKTADVGLDGHQFCSLQFDWFFSRPPQRVCSGPRQMVVWGFISGLENVVIVELISRFWYRKAQKDIYLRTNITSDSMPIVDP